jgi:integrase
MPPPKTTGRPRRTCLRDVVDALLYIATTGCRWRMLSKGTQDCLHTYLNVSERPLHGWLFTGQGARWSHVHISESQLWRLFKSWLEKARLDPALYGLHSLRRTFPTYIYKQTGNLRAAQLLLGHTSIESTKEYIGTEQAEALEIACKFHI